MRKFFALLIIFIITMFLGITAYADSAEIIIASNDIDLENIEAQSTTIDISINIKDLSDVYAFTLEMNYTTDKIQVEAISVGDIFEDYGNAVLVNSIDNTAGKVEFMQTMLSVDTGVSDDKTLCIIRITFDYGEYDINDLGIIVKIANSVPEYIETYVSSGNIIINEPTTESTKATPTLAPIATAQIGVITPNPNSEQSQDFVEAEDESIEEILETIKEEEAKKEEVKKEDSKSLSNDTKDDETNTDENLADILKETNTTTNTTPKIDKMTLILIIVLAILIPIIIFSLILYSKQNKKPKDLYISDIDKHGNKDTKRQNQSITRSRDNNKNAKSKGNNRRR